MAGKINSLESIPGLRKSLKNRLRHMGVGKGVGGSIYLLQRDVKPDYITEEKS